MAADLIAVLSHAVTDEVHAPSGELVTRTVGGAGAYAAAGASLASAPWRAVIVSGVGASDRDRLVSWFRDREVDDSGLFTVGERSPVTKVSYLDDGERVERSLLGDEHFEAHTPLPEHLPMAPDQLAGCYLFHDVDERYWAEVDALRRRWTGPVLWEIAADACVPENLSVVRELTEVVDVISLNVTEARALLGSDDPGEVVRRLARRDTAVVLRRGAAGSVVVTPGGAWTVGAPDTSVVDPTGGGNCYSGAFLASYVRTGDEGAAARTAAAAASQVIAQHGAPRVDEHARARVRAEAAAVSVSPVDEGGTVA